MQRMIEGAHVCDWSDRELRLRATLLEKAGRYRAGSVECRQAAELLAFVSLRRRLLGWRRGEGEEAAYRLSPEELVRALERLRAVVDAVAEGSPEGFTPQAVERALSKGRPVQAVFPSGRTPWGHLRETWQA